MKIGWLIALTLVALAIVSGYHAADTLIQSENDRAVASHEKFFQETVKKQTSAVMAFGKLTNLKVKQVIEDSP